MSAEADFIAALRGLATSPSARGLADDAAVLEVGGRRLVLTHDVLAEGVHFLAGDPPGDVAWKLLAVNLSDLAAKGATPLGVLLGYPLGEQAWNRAFVEGLGVALEAVGVPLLGGDTVAAPRVLGLTAIGEAAGPVPSRSGARPGDSLWVTGTIGDSGAGLRALAGGLPADDFLVARYRRPVPRLEAGRRLAPQVSAMMDVSDGLLADSSCLAEASGVAVAIDLEQLPMSDPCRRLAGDDLEARIAAATAGDDYELLFTASPAQAGEIEAIGAAIGLPMTRLGACRSGEGLSLTAHGKPIPLPARLGWEHGGGS
jgi:thiamine-monophosphate kinase